MSVQNTRMRNGVYTVEVGIFVRRDANVGADDGLDGQADSEQGPPLKQAPMRWLSRCFVFTGRATCMPV